MIATFLFDNIVKQAYAVNPNVPDWNHILQLLTMMENNPLVTDSILDSCLNVLDRSRKFSMNILIIIDSFLRIQKGLYC